MSGLPNSVTKESLEDLIAKSEVVYTNPVGTLTHCVITLPCGYGVTGESACVDPAKYDKAIGEKYALEQAVDKLWPLEGYLLANDRYRAEQKRTDKYAGEFVPCTAPKDPDHVLTGDEIVRLAETGSLCDCADFTQYGGDCPIEEGDQFDFGSAIHLLKMGKKVMRAGWNGKGMFVYYVPAASYPADRNSKSTMAGEFADDMVPYREYLALKTAQNDVSTWAPSVSDALAEDWQLA